MRKATLVLAPCVQAAIVAPLIAQNAAAPPAPVPAAQAGAPQANCDVSGGRFRVRGLATRSAPGIVGPIVRDAMTSSSGSAKFPAAPCYERPPAAQQDAA